ncbi:hypothetical protein ACFL0N_01735 [Pseudomonadota bacterium]
MTAKKPAPSSAPPVDEHAIIIDSLAMRVAQLAVDVAQWRARALIAEGTPVDSAD